MEITEAQRILEKNIRPVRDSLMVPRKASYGCVAGCDITAKDVFADEGITEEHVVISKGTRIGRREAGIISKLGLFEVRIRRPASVAVITVVKSPGKRGFFPVKGQALSSIPAMLDYSISDVQLEVSMNSVCTDHEKSICREIRKGVGGSDLVITSGGISNGEKDPLSEALKSLGAGILFKNAGDDEGALNRAHILGKKLILSLSSDPVDAMRDFDSFFYCCASKLMQCEMLCKCRQETDH